MSAPLVSVIMPVHNRPALLPLAVQSVFAQTYTEWELLIADDGSTDATVRVLAELHQPPRVRITRLAHSGNPAVVRNAALREARGEFLAFLDSDDQWMPEKLALQMALLRTQPARRWSYTGFLHVDASGEPLADGAFERWQPCDGEVFAATVTGRAPIRTASVAMAQRALVEEVGGFDEALDCGQDYDLWMRLALRSEVSVVRSPLTAVRVHAASHSMRFPPRALELRALSLRKIAGSAPAQWQPLIAAQLRRNAAALAASYLAQGAAGEMLASMRRSLASCWRDPRWWASSARTLLRAGWRRRARERSRALAS
ncbi:MAG TPA: glycosyltransferase [Steroidobacteraceae bacterium]|nr:glycosyltransferase [Steroidobacteraceae bacterium]